jgi:NADPH-dependent glutamate synthase beta subunit-like oxidoreductase
LPPDVATLHPGYDAELVLDPRGNVKADTVTYRSSNPKVFACGDMRAASRW